MEKGKWFEDDAFWRDMEPKIYSSDQWKSAGDEIEKALALIDISAVSSILDMGCGTGRHSIELARLGHRVTGVDLNVSYLAAAKHTAFEAGLAVDFIHGDMRTYQYVNAFEAALILWNAFGYFDSDEEDIAALRALHASLSAGGKLLIQTHGREATARKFVRKDWFEIGGRLVLDQRWIEQDWSIMRTRYVIVDATGRREHTMTCRLYSPDQLKALLSKAGFEQIKIFGGLNGAPYDEKAFELVATAVKSI